MVESKLAVPKEQMVGVPENADKQVGAEKLTEDVAVAVQPAPSVPVTV